MATGKADRVLFLADCGPEVGGGHVMRCLALAGALLARGADCAFLASPDVGRVLDVFADHRIGRLAADAAGGPGDLVQAGAQAAEGWGADLVVVDHYGLQAEQEAALRGDRRRIAALDDLAGRAHDCDLLIDPTLGRSPEAYAGLVPAGARALTGAGYALLRPEYGEERVAALARRRPEEPPRRLLISLGLMDLRGITGRVLHLIRPLARGLDIDIVVGSGAPSLDVLGQAAGQDPRLWLHVDSRDMAGLIAAADIGIGAGGSSAWERAALGLPSLSLILADNQQDSTLELDRRGAALAVDARVPGFAAELPQAFRRLMEDSRLRARLSRTSAGLYDGSGAGRVADAILDLLLRKA